MPRDEDLTQPPGYFAGAPEESWESALLACQVLAAGRSEELAAEVVGVDVEVLKGWREQPWWEDVERAAKRETYVRLATMKTLKSLLDVLDARHPMTVRWAAERLLPEFAPPKQRIEHSGDLQFYQAGEERLVGQLARLAGPSETT